MSWRAISTDQILAEFNSTEQELLQDAQESTTALAQILADTVAEFISAMTAAQYNVNTDGTVPDYIRRHVMARARWGWLLAFPQLKQLQTDARKAAADDAVKLLEAIAQRKAGAIEDPAGTASPAANWNSRNRISLRTEPTPPVSTQMPPESTTPGYANPDAPTDN